MSFSFCTFKCILRNMQNKCKMTDSMSKRKGCCCSGPHQMYIGVGKMDNLFLKLKWFSRWGFKLKINFIKSATSCSSIKNILNQFEYSSFLSLVQQSCLFIFIFYILFTTPKIIFTTFFFKLFTVLLSAIVSSFVKIYNSVI